MYAFESNPSRRGLHAMVIGAAVAAILLLTVSGMGAPLPMLFQLGAVICAALAVYLTTRYSLRAYRYAVEPGGIIDETGAEVPDLVITEIANRRMTVVMRVALRDIEGVTVVDRSDRAAMAATEANRGRQVFRYANVPRLPRECRIILRDEPAIVVIPVDDRMVEILRSDWGSALPTFFEKKVGPKNFNSSI